MYLERGKQSCSRRERREVRVEAVGALLRLERPRFEVVPRREIARLRQAQRIGSRTESAPVVGPQSTRAETV
jgi:hypothetical protein